MTIQTFTAKTMREALSRVQKELGPDATLLRTRQLPSSEAAGESGSRPRIEIIATADSDPIVERTLPDWSTELTSAPPAGRGAPRRAERRTARSPNSSTAAAPDQHLRTQIVGLQEMVRQLRQQSDDAAADARNEAFARLTAAGIPDGLAGDLIRRAPSGSHDGALDASSIVTRIAKIMADEIRVSGPIQLAADRCRLVALVGPTGVGKTTTIAKLAARFRLREKRKVALITVDTYRIAAVDQLQTYADIIDLPMEVVSTPREMRAAIERLGDQNLILVDTAGRSPQDEVKLRELKSLLAESQADEIHLVLSSVAGSSQLTRSAQQFAQVGTTHLILTKLDEAAGLGHLLEPLQGAGLALSYLTHGQNVPDDIDVAEARNLVNLVLDSRIVLATPATAPPSYQPSDELEHFIE